MVTMTLFYRSTYHITYHSIHIPEWKLVILYSETTYDHTDKHTNIPLTMYHRYMYIVDGLLVCLLKNWFAIQDQSKKKRLQTNTLCTSIPLGTYPCLQWRSVFWSSSLIYPGCANLSTRYWFSHSQHDISCSIFNDPTLSLIARMIEKYACFKCWYLKYQSIGIKYMCFHIYLFQYLWRNYRCFINGNNMNLPCPLTFYVLQKSYHCTWIMFYGNYMKMLII